MVRLAADSAPTIDFSSDSLVHFIDYGVLGLIVLCAILGIIWFKPAIDDLKRQRDRLVEERDRAYLQRDEMALTFQRELLPPLLKFLSTSEALLPVLQRMAERGGDHR